MTALATVALSERIAAKRGANVAVVAVARKMVVIAWHMLTKQEDYAFTRPSSGGK